MMNSMSGVGGLLSEFTQVISTPPWLDMQLPGEDMKDVDVAKAIIPVS